MKNSLNICIMLMGISLILAAISFDNVQGMTLFGLVISCWGLLREIDNAPSDDDENNDAE